MTSDYKEGFVNELGGKEGGFYPRLPVSPKTTLDKCFFHIHRIIYKSNGSSFLTLKTDYYRKSTNELCIEITNRTKLHHTFAGNNFL